MTQRKQRQRRVFKDEPARRSNINAFIGIAGATGSGKTFSMLRLAAGMQQVVGGDIRLIDTEAGRGTHYSDDFRYRCMPFPPPYNPLSYLDVIEQAREAGSRVIIVDQASHEHEGVGGVLEMHEAELAAQKGKQDKFRAWAAPKAERRQLVQRITQMDAHIIFGFRAKEVLKPMKKAGKNGQQRTEIVNLGWMPVGGRELMFEMLLLGILYPGARGVPKWVSTMPGEDMMIKCPRQFEHFIREPRQFDEAMGREIALWAKGGPTINVAVEWPGRSRWGGTALDLVPAEDLRAYRAELGRLVERAKGRKRANIEAHIGEVDAVLPAEALQQPAEPPAGPSEAIDVHQDDEPPPDVELPTWEGSGA